MRVAWALLPDQLAQDVFVEVDASGRLVAVRPGRLTDGPLQPGVLVPGLVNAHLHLELSWVDAGGLPEQQGLVPWVDALLARIWQWTDDTTWQQAVHAGARSLVEAGTTLVSDVSNSGRTAEVLAEHGLGGVVQHEFYTLDHPAIAPMVERIDAYAPREVDRVTVRPAPHAPYSSDPRIVEAVVRWGARHAHAPPSTIHLAEDPEELRFLADRTGAWADQLDRLERDWAHWQAPGLGPVEWLASLGALGPDMLLVHGVLLTPAERQQVREAGAAVCLCPRSNLAITGQLPDVPGLLRDGVRLCLGTDSLASSPDLDVLGEVPVLARAFPDVPLATWLRLASEGGARALGHASGLEVGRAPGLVHLHATPKQLLEQAPERTVLAARED